MMFLSYIIDCHYMRNVLFNTLKMMVIVYLLVLVNLVVKVKIGDIANLKESQVINIMKNILLVGIVTSKTQKAKVEILSMEKIKV